jgi:multidrug efflux pump subunit AcrB
MVQLQHFGKTVLVMVSGPLGVIGAATALLVFQAPFGFVAILGVIALAGARSCRSAAAAPLGGEE